MVLEFSVIFLFASTLIGQGISFGKVYLFHLVLLFALVILIVKNRKQLIDIKSIKSISPLIALGLFAIVSLARTTNIVAGITECIQLWLGIVFIYLLLSSKIDSNKIFQGLRIVLWINLLISVAEGFQLFRYPFSQYSELGIYFKKNHYDWYPQVNDWPTGFHWNPNNNAFFILIFFPLFLSNVKRWEGWAYYLLASWVIFMTSSKLILIAWVFMSCLLVINFLFKQSKKVLITSVSVLVCAFFIAVSGFKISDKRRAEKYSKTIPSIVNFIQLVPNIFLKRFNSEPVEFDYRSTDFSLHERLTYLDGIAQVIRDNFWFGVGAGGLHDKKNVQAGHQLGLATPHFYLLEVFAKYGFFFILIYFFWIGSLIRDSFKKDRMNTFSLFLFIIFSPVISSASYFLPKWGLFGFQLLDSEEPVQNPGTPIADQ